MRARCLFALITVLASCGRGAAPVRSPVRGLALARVWGSPDGAPRWHVDRLEAAWLAPNGQWAVLAGPEEAVLVAVPSGTRAGGLPIAVRSDDGSVAFSPDSRRIAIVDPRRGCVAIWSTATVHEDACLPAGDAAEIAFSPDSASIAIAGGGQLVRWSLAAAAKTWSVPVPISYDNQSHFVAWASPDVLLHGDHDATARDAATGRALWRSDTIVERYLGVYRGDAIVLGKNGASTSLWHMDLASGTVRDPIGTADPWRGGALFDDGTVILIDHLGVVRHHRLNGAELASYLLAPRSTLVAQRDGSRALLVAAHGITLLDPRTGTPIAIRDMQTGPIIALDADHAGIVSASANGSVVLRRHDGRLLVRRQARVTHCLAWAVSARTRQAVCAADLVGYESLRLWEPASHEWIDLDTDRRRFLDWFLGQAVALGEPGVFWAASPNHGTWVDLQSLLPDRANGLGTPLGEMSPRVARVVSGAVAHGGVSFSRSPHGNDRGTWLGKGLALVTRRGVRTVLDAELDVVTLGTNRPADQLAVATLQTHELWRDTSAGWTRQWSVERAHPEGSTTAIALGDDGALVAAAEADGRVIVLYNGLTGAVIGELAVDPLRSVTALDFDDDRLYAGTVTGLVLAFDLRRK